MLKEEAEKEAEEVEGIDDLSAGVVGQNNYEEPGPRGSTAEFLPGVEMEGDTLGREEVEADAHNLIINDSNKTTAPVDGDQVKDDDDDQVDEVKLTKKMPQRRKIYGWNQKRGGSRKLGDGGEDIAYIPPVAPTRFAVALDPDTRVTSITSNIKYIPKKTLFRQLQQMEVNI